LDAGKADAQALKFQAEQEKINAQLRSNERQQRLLDSMAANNATLGARGITSEGSPQSILQADFKKASKEAQVDLLDSRMAQISLKAKAKAAVQMSRIQAVSSLLGTGIDIASTGVSVPKGSKPAGGTTTALGDKV
jgi:hypothetical protein